MGVICENTSSYLRMKPSTTGPFLSSFFGSDGKAILEKFIAKGTKRCHPQQGHDPNPESILFFYLPVTN